jgi:mycoredoxin-dependent peroxiredoxin
MTLSIGDSAPEFSLPNQFGQPVNLADFRGRKNVLLIFYPAAFTGTCTGELCSIRDRADQFDTDDVAVLGISCDPKASLKAFAEQEGFSYPLLSDFWPHGAVASAYGVFLPAKGFANRGTFVVDKSGILRWSVVTSTTEARSPDDYRAALAAL